MLNWVVWNRTVYLGMDLELNNRQRFKCHKTQTNILAYLCILRYEDREVFLYSYGDIDGFFYADD